MESNMPNSGDFYRHFKGNLYQVKMLAKDSETGAVQVVYQAMYPPFQYWIRPLDMFLAPVDSAKYPDMAGKRRFEKVTSEELREISASSLPVTSEEGKSTAFHTADELDMPEETSVYVRKDADAVDDETLLRALRSGQPDRYLKGCMTEQEIAERGYMKVLDAETYYEKRQLMIGMKPYLDKRLLHNIAASLDIVLEEGSLDSQYDSLLRCLDTMEHFEGGRLR